MSDEHKDRCGDKANDPPGQEEPCDAAPPAGAKRPFVEPAVSVPADVLEATAMFQAPTVQTSITN